MRKLFLVAICLCLGAVSIAPALAQDAPPAPPTLELDTPVCLEPASTPPDLEAPPIVETIGGRTCGAFLPDGSPNPDWPECNSSDGGTIPGPSCDGIGMCYCFCRFYHRCDLDPNECTPLANCLNDCDAQYPGCPYPGGGYPSSPGECL